ncbi:hypothetical protein IT411_00985, partial [Candidatus Peregrinibacteria bacterium]|nr:hypothetical protein [Candidatus Peregrinibacteria bacterium]
MSGEKPQLKDDPQQKSSPDAAMQKAVETDHVHEESKDILADTADFVSSTEKLNAVERKEVLEKAKEWERNGDLDLLRAAGLSLDQIKKNPQERHIKLASLFLHREKSKPGLVFRLGYEGNEMAQWDLDLADVLPSNILKVDIYDQDGKLLFPDAERGFEEGRPGYFHGKPPKRVAVQENYQVKVKQTQNGLAITDRRAGIRTHEHALKEELYMVDNSRKTVLKQEIRKQAAAQGKEVKTDKSFFDNILSDLMKAFDPKIWENFQETFKIDFSKIQTQLNGLLASLGMPIAAKALSDSPSSDSPSPAATAYGDRISKIGSGSESLNAPRINRDWLLQNVGDSPDKVERFMVGINFLGVNMRVNK